MLFRHFSENWCKDSENRVKCQIYFVFYSFHLTLSSLRRWGGENKQRNKYYSSFPRCLLSSTKLKVQIIFNVVKITKFFSYHQIKSHYLIKKQPPNSEQFTARPAGTLARARICRFSRTRIKSEVLCLMIVSVL